MGMTRSAGAVGRVTSLNVYFANPVWSRDLVPAHGDWLGEMVVDDQIIKLQGLSSPFVTVGFHSMERLIARRARRRLTRLPTWRAVGRMASGQRWQAGKRRHTKRANWDRRLIPLFRTCSRL